MSRFIAPAIVAASLFVSTNIAAACSACGCSFNSDWASEGYSFQPGLRLDVRFSYLEQNQLRSGTGRYFADSHSDASHSEHGDSGDVHAEETHGDVEEHNHHRGARQVSPKHLLESGDREIQDLTITRETLIGADYQFTPDWSIRTLVPILDRTHSTFAEGDDTLSYSEKTGVGDIQLLGRYQGFLPQKNLGVQLGVKLPTGNFTQDFSDGPQSGSALDRGLNLGTGTTDLVFGVYHFGVILPGELEYFLSSFGNEPFAERDGFRPGLALTTSGGLSYSLLSWLKPQFQVNYQYEGREQGENADRDNSGLNAIFLTPGLNVTLADKRLNLYSLLQIPVFQDVNGVQLRPQVIPSFGARYLF